MGPVLVEQRAPDTPAILHVAVPVGVAPPVPPVTVAVKVKVEPRVAVEELVETETVGVILLRGKLNVALGPAEL